MKEWYLISQGIICSLSAFLFFLMYLKGLPEDITEAEKNYKRDNAFFYIGFALLIWGLWAWIAYFFPRIREDNITRIFGSTFNSAFFLLAIAYFDYGPEALKIFQNKKKWRTSVLVGALSVVFFTSYLSQDNPELVKYPDVILSVFTSIIMMLAIISSFNYRGFSRIAIFSCGVFLYVLFVNLIELDWIKEGLKISEEDDQIFLLTYKIGLILILLTLGFSWAYERWEESIYYKKLYYPLQQEYRQLINSLQSLQALHRELQPSFDRIHIRFTGKREGRYFIALAKEPGHKEEKKVLLTEQLHKILLNFVITRMCDKSDNGGWINLEKSALWPTDVHRIWQKITSNRSMLFENNHSGSYRFRGTASFDMAELAKDPDLRNILTRL